MKAPDPQQLKAQRAEASGQLTQGAKKCPDCGNMPHGLKQPRSVAGLPQFELVEIGCLVCRNHRAFGSTREEAVQSWNGKKYLATAAAPATPPQ